MHFEISYAGLDDAAYKEIAMGVLAAQNPRWYKKVRYSTLRALYILLDVLMLFIIMGGVALLFYRALPTFGVLLYALAFVAAALPGIWVTRLYVAARNTWKAYKKTFSEAAPGVVTLDETGIQVERRDGQKRTFLGWSTLTTGTESPNFYCLCQSSQMVWVVPKACLGGQQPAFKALLQTHYLAGGHTLPYRKP